MEEQFYKYVDVTEAAKDLGLPKELMKRIHAYWTLKRKVCACVFATVSRVEFEKVVRCAARDVGTYMIRFRFGISPRAKSPLFTAENIIVPIEY